MMSGMSSDDGVLEKLVQELSSQASYDGKAAFTKRVSKLKRDYQALVKNSELRRVYDLMVKEGRLVAHPQIALFLRTKGGKSSSGILSVTVFTSPYPEYVDKNGKTKKQRFTCEWNCYYCPNHPDHPRSYLPDEPGCLRAERCVCSAVECTPRTIPAHPTRLFG